MKLNHSKTAILLVFLLAFAGACSVLSHNDPEKDIRTFVSQFQHSLSGPDSQILDFFNSNQSKDAIFAAIRVLQNKDSLNVKCQAFFEQASIITIGKESKVTVRANISADTLTVSMADTTSFVLYLVATKGKLAITRVDGDQFYNTYVGVRRAVVSASQDQEISEKYTHYFEAVKSLQQTYDSVVWAVHYNHKSYYYVIKGDWNSERSGEYKMGLVDQAGNIIVPVSYSLVCTPGFVLENVVEVRENGLTGYYSMEGRQLVAPEYEWIMPLDEPGVYALAQKGGTIGWLDKAKTFKPDYPSLSAKKYFLEYGYLSSITMSADRYAAAEIPSETAVGAGYIMPASYLVAGSYFPEVIGDFSMGTTGEFRANTQSVEASYTFMESVLNKVDVLVKVVTNNYLEGREGFYTDRQLDFLNKDHEVISSEKELYGELSFNTIDSTLLEVKCVYKGDGDDYMGGPPEDEREISGMPSYIYFRLTGEAGVPTRVPSHRSYSFTEFIKLNDDYITGEFSYYDKASETYGTRDKLCEASLIIMRNEILADYGYIFEDPADAEHFKHDDWYQPRYNAVTDFYDAMTEVDKFNLAFLIQLVGPVEKESS